LKTRATAVTVVLCALVAMARAETFEAEDHPLATNGAQGELAELLEQYRHPPQRFSYTMELIDEQPLHRMYKLTYPSPFESPWPENNVVPAEFYLPRKATGKMPAIIVLDILNGAEVLPRMMSRRFADDGIAALYIPMASYGPRRPADLGHRRRLQQDPTTLVEGIRQTIMDIRRAKSLLASREEIDGEHISITGVSLGGIVSALAAGVDGDFDRVILILAGGDLHEIIFHTWETRHLREQLEATGHTRETTRDLLRPVEPLNFASRIDAVRCLMINAEADEVIPRSTTEALRRAIGEPTLLWAPLGHYTSAIYLPNMLRKSIDFLRGEEVTTLSFTRRTVMPRAEEQ
jgi:dienelactone hydrolase